WPVLRRHRRRHEYVCPTGGDVSHSPATAQGGVCVDDRRLFARRTNTPSREFGEPAVTHRPPAGHSGAVLWAECLRLSAGHALAAYHQSATLREHRLGRTAASGAEPRALRSAGTALAIQLVCGVSLARPPSGRPAPPAYSSATT